MHLELFISYPHSKLYSPKVLWVYLANLFKVSSLSIVFICFASISAFWFVAPIISVKNNLTISFASIIFIDSLSPSSVSSICPYGS